MHWARITSAHDPGRASLPYTPGTYPRTELLWQADARDGGRRSIAYATRGTTAPEAKLHSLGFELLAAKWALDKFDKWIYRQKVLLETDCQVVRELMKNKAMPGTRSVWKEAIATSGIVRMVHRPGRINTIVNALSRKWLGSRKRDDSGL